MEKKGLTKTYSRQKEDEFILFSDLFVCLKKHVLSIIFYILLFASLGFFFRLIRDVKYEVKATFKESNQPTTVAFGVVEQIFNSVQVKKPLNCFSLIQSHFLLKKVIEKLGLQISVFEKGYMKPYLTTIKENWKTERKKNLKDPESFDFENVDYKGEKGRNYSLIFQTPNLYEIHLSKKGKIASGEVGKSLTFDGVTFTLVKTPKKLKYNDAYSLSLQPYMSLYSFLKKEMTIQSHVKDRWTYEFTFYHRDRNLAKRILNALLEEYENYLCVETENLAREQIAYLEKRKRDFCLQMDRDLSEHVSFLKENLGKEGFLSLDRQLNIFQKKKSFFLNKKEALDKQESYLVESGMPLDEEEEFLSLETEMQSLKKQRDTLDLAFFSSYKEENEKVKIPYTYAEEKIFGCQKRLEEIAFKKKKFDLGADQGRDFLFSLFPDLFVPLTKMRSLRFKEISSIPISYVLNMPLALELKGIRGKKSKLKEYLSKISFEREKEGALSKEDERSYLEHQLRLISLQEAILKERLFYPKKYSLADRGIDLNEARKIYQKHLRKKECLEDECEKLKFAKGHLGDVDFEYISLSQILPDPVSSALVEEMGKLVQAIRNSSDVSALEFKRLKQLFKFKQIDLKRYIEQKIALDHSQIKRLGQKIRALRFTILDLLNREISLIEKQIEDRIEQKQKALQTERVLVEGQLQNIEEKLLHVPDQWLRENQLQFKSRMNVKMLEAMAELVESKSIQHRLSQIQSKILDSPYAQIHPRSPYLKLFSLIGGVIGLIIGFFLIIIREYVKGFPLTLKNIEMQGWKNLGCFSSSFRFPFLKKIGRNDLEILREISMFISQNQTLQIFTLFTHQRCQYAPFLAELLAKEGKRVLLIAFDPFLKKEKREIPSLFSYLRKESQEMSIQVAEGYDITVALEEDLFTFEHLKKLRFDLFLKAMKKNYEVILLSSFAFPQSMIGKYFLFLSDRVIITLKDLSNQHLYTYFNWARREGEEKLAFVSCL